MRVRTETGLQQHLLLHILYTVVRVSPQGIDIRANEFVHSAVQSLNVPQSNPTPIASRIRHTELQNLSTHTLDIVEKVLNPRWCVCVLAFSCVNVDVDSIQCCGGCDAASFAQLTARCCKHLFEDCACYLNSQ
uniref:C2 domain-containing protein 3 n=1 Tax=Lygus hesperus TaxID=30085 RepID=A0A0A9XTY2_LYGHE